MDLGRHAFSGRELAAQVAAERRGSPFLVYRDSAGELELRTLEQVDRVSIGRSDRSDLPLAWDPEVSRAHAQLELVGEDWTLIDDGLSRNGTFVNGERVRGRRRLLDGDVMRFGSTQVLYRRPDEGVMETAPATEAVGQLELSPAQRRALVALCRPLARPGVVATPASNRQIAEELSISTGGVKAHLKALFTKLAIEDLPQNRKRAELARRALEWGLVSSRDFDP